jgi:phosphoribosyl 1,2-cyclic phosphodiesterase/ActR/RegA family two-component response regulator
MSNTASPKGRILIGEDVRLIATERCRALEQGGYAVEIATDGEKCVAKARALLPDLIVVDLVLPRLHGIDVLETLQADAGTREIGVLICTAKDFLTDQREAAAHGAIAYLVEPVDPAELVAKVDAYFELRSVAPAKPQMNAPEVKASAEVYDLPFDECGNRYALWGSRGSTPTPGARFLKHGGNTSCFCVTYGDVKYIFDAGSGIRELSGELMRSKRHKVQLFITHTHWDHIQGFPFFTPAYVPGFEITVWGAELFGKDLRSVFSGQLDRDYFPVQMEDMNANLEFRHLPSEPIVFKDVKVSWEYSQHPGATVGYKIDIGGKKIAWVPDNEFLQGYTGDPHAITRDHPQLTPYRKMIQFLSDVDILIHEAQYTPAEYAQKVGWGHSSLTNACLLVKFAGVRRWIVTHHDPQHDDEFLEKKLAMTRLLLRQLEHECSVVHGYDGMTEFL